MKAETKTMNGYFHSVNAESLLNPHVRQMAEKLAVIWKENTNTSDRDVIMVDWGTWLEQSAWVDNTGWFLKFRLTPMYNHLLPVKEHGRMVLKAFKDLFPNAKEVIIDNEDAVYDGTKDTVTVVVHTDTHSIGD